jgi:hypothetical protein
VLAGVLKDLLEYLACGTMIFCFTSSAIRRRGGLKVDQSLFGGFDVTNSRTISQMLA